MCCMRHGSLLWCTTCTCSWLWTAGDTDRKAMTQRLYASTDSLLVAQAINIMSLGVDFEITQIVDSNVGIHAKIPK